MSKRGKILGAIAFVLIIVSVLMFLFGDPLKGAFALAITFIYVMVLSVISSFNKAKLRRREMEDLHRIANKIDKEE